MVGVRKKIRLECTVKKSLDSERSEQWIFHLSFVNRRALEERGWGSGGEHGTEIECWRPTLF